LRVLVFSLKGWDSIAQGVALGGIGGFMQPEGLRHAELLSQPFRLED
jgi:hypothetical protein